jgi:hypothetical protein
MFNCVCNTLDDDYTYEPYFRDPKSVACEDLTCCECGDLIPSGSTYEHAWGFLPVDGSRHDHTTCTTCARIANDLCPEGRLHEGLEEALEVCGMGFGDPANWPDWDEEEG